ncbi:uncharacterized protein BO80DRAFT_36143 [Aspergillus ibericus CBS 121593]|uniref:DUF6314 domain-containing protein n=1 Tax=Aspergillus ibericus CBS 121593 TaxID=1448316 RepID=A0A395H8B9_9EURO|nr:hypothetical protein BO80DRAFT_36143 [Aspergillus ibericus CBS 121593]RAL02464.1 hypothetical protein BO80DRAFT_36143 [Aspergillus ibericus CBS 121593]
MTTPTITTTTMLNIPTLFTSLTRHPWTLLRVLKSANPHDIQGPLHGTASFTLLPSTTPSSSSPSSTQQPPPSTDPNNNNEHWNQILYTETGTLPTTLGQNLQWKKSYIWRLTIPGNELSVWFVKVAEPEVADYLFHGMEFIQSAHSSSSSLGGLGIGDADTGTGTGEEFVSAPVPPPAGKGEEEGEGTVVVTAKGNHLCINDMYRTAYAFRVREGDGEVVSWASRHVVKGPKKDQDIVNYYSV